MKRMEKITSRRMFRKRKERIMKQMLFSLLLAGIGVAMLRISKR
jgi:hypothetical protein